MFYSNLYEKNIFLLYLVYFFKGFIISWNVIYILFLQEKSLTFFQISSLVFFTVLFIFLFEFPTGIISDIYGRKLSLILFSIFIGLSSLILAFSNFYIHFFFAVLFFSIGSAFFSGTGDSILYESLKNLKREKEYTKLFSRNHFIFISLGILTNFLIPLLFEYNNKYPFFLASIFSFFSLFICFNFYEKSLKKKLNFNFFNKYKNHFNKLKIIFKLERKLFFIFIFSAILATSQGIFGDVLNQPLIKETSTYLEYGFLFALATIIQSLLILKTDLIINFSKKFNSYLFIMFIWVISLIILLIVPIYLIPFVMGFSWFCGSLRSIFVSSKINSFIKNNSYRASIHSLNSMFDSLIYLPILLIFGYILDFVSLSQGVIILSFLTLIFGLLFFFFYKE